MIIIINTKITPKIVILICPVPTVLSPAAIVKKRYINSSGSLIAALNLLLIDLKILFYFFIFLHFR